VTKRAIIAAAVLSGIVAAILVVVALARSPTGGSLLTQPPGGWADRSEVFSWQLMHSRPGQCLSDIFIEYRDDASGEAGPHAAVRSFRPDVQDLPVQPFSPEGAVVEQFDRRVKVAAYDVLRTERGGWVVVQAETWSSCSGSLNHGRPA
jgi:hypothetical protein